MLIALALSHPAIPCFAKWPCISLGFAHTFDRQHTHATEARARIVLPPIENPDGVTRVYYTAINVKGECFNQDSWTIARFQISDMLRSNIDAMEQRSSFWTGRHYAFLFIPWLHSDERNDVWKIFTNLRYSFFLRRIILNEFSIGYRVNFFFFL